MKKKLLPALLALVMVLGLLPLAALAEDTVTLKAGISENATAMESAVKTALSATSVDVSGAGDAVHLLWIAMKGLTANTEYTLSMKSGDKELLTAKSIDASKESGSATFTPSGSGYLNYVSLDNEWQYNKSNLAAGEYTITVTAKDASSPAATLEVTLAQDNSTSAWSLTEKKAAEPDPEETTSPEPTPTPTPEPTPTPTPEAKGLTFNVYPNTDGNATSFGGQKVSDLGKFEVKQDSTNPTKITITGTANYIESWTAFNEAVKAEQSGWYLAYQVQGTQGQTIKVGASDADGKPTTKDLTFGEDGSFEFVTHIDPKNTSKTFTVKHGEMVYTVDYSSVTLLPKAAEGTTIEAKPGESEGDPGSIEAATDDGHKAEIPADLENLSSMTIEVKSASIDSSAAIENEALKAAITANTAKAVEVTIKIDDKEQFTDAEALKDKEITVTISGLTSGTTYYVLCVKDDGTVSSYGRVTLGSAATSLSLKTQHLTKFVAVPEPTAEADKTAFVEAVKAVEKTHKEATKVEGGEYVSGDDDTGVTATYIPNNSLTGGDAKYFYGKLTISGLTNGNFYLIGLDKGDASFRSSLVVQADASGEISLPCQKALSLVVFDVTDNGDFDLTDLSNALIEKVENEGTPQEIHMGVPVMELVD